MKWLSRTEEMLLLAVHALGEDAYGLSVRNYLQKLSGKHFSVGAIYVPLERLEEKGLLTSKESEPIAERGGRSKRLYCLTSQGANELAEVKRLSDALWARYRQAVGSYAKQSAT